MTRPEKSFCVLILAAGKGTRMHSGTPKVLHAILEEPLLYYPLAAVSGTGIKDVGVVVGFGGEQVEEWLLREFPETEVIWQKEQLGTGHAAKLARRWWQDYDNVMVLPGDTPLITSNTLKALAENHVQNQNKCNVLSFDIENPAGYGRVIREGSSVRIVEHKDASPEEAMCREVNSGMYIFDTKALSAVIDNLGSDNAQREYYLPDALRLVAEAGGAVSAIKCGYSDEFLGVNDPKQLADAASVMRSRILDKMMSELGVKCADPLSTWIGPKAVVGADVTVEPNVQIWGHSVIGQRSRIGSFTVLRDAVLGEDVTITGSARINGSRICAGASVGPFVFIRENAVIGEDARIGRFVEIKKSKIGKGSKVPHLSYVGDAEIGAGTNIGAGTITCNYDGEKKSATIIGDNCFVGSDTMLVAPVRLGDNSATGAGSVITSDVPEGALGVGRARQRNIENWKARASGDKEGGK